MVVMESVTTIQGVEMTTEYKTTRYYHQPEPPTKGWTRGDRARVIDTGEEGTVKRVDWAQLAIEIDDRGTVSVYPVRFVERIEEDSNE